MLPAALPRGGARRRRRGAALPVVSLPPPGLPWQKRSWSDALRLGWQRAVPVREGGWEEGGDAPRLGGVRARGRGPPVWLGDQTARLPPAVGGCRWCVLRAVGRRI